MHILIEDRLYTHGFRGSHKWISVTVIKVTGPLSYQVQDPSGYVFHNHFDHSMYCYDSEYSRTDNVVPDDYDDWPI